MKNIFKIMVTATTAVLVAILSRGVSVAASMEIELCPDMTSLASCAETSQNICKQLYELAANYKELEPTQEPVQYEPEPIPEPTPEPVQYEPEPAPEHEPVQYEPEPAPEHEPVQSTGWVVSPYGKGKMTKQPPADLDLTVNIRIENGIRYYERTGMSISEQDYILLCNLVGHEYGSYYVPDWERALCVEVVHNRAINSGTSYYDVITAPYQFSGSSSYANNTQFTEYDHQYDEDFNGELSRRIQASVDFFFAFIDYFGEGYLYFSGDGSWNYFNAGC